MLRILSICLLFSVACSARNYDEDYPYESPRVVQYHIQGNAYFLNIYEMPDSSHFGKSTFAHKQLKDDDGKAKKSSMSSHVGKVKRFWNKWGDKVVSTAKTVGVFIPAILLAL